ncbi:MAG: NUDIX domain-containing protein [archaeon]
MNELFECNLEEEKGTDLSKLESGNLPLEDYVAAHKNMIVPCHDIFIQYNGGILLVRRDNQPMRDTIWPIGGRIQRGVKTEDSLRLKVKQETRLDITDITFLGSARIFMHTEPFGHGKGTDNTAFVFFAVGNGNLKLDNLHKDPMIVMPSEYPRLRPELHPYVKKFMDGAIKLVK